MALIRQFLQSTFDILSDSRFMGFGMQIRLIQCDSRIQSEIIIKSIEELKRFMENFQLIGRGGTDFRPVFERVDKLLEKGDLRELDGLIYFTDGRGIFPKDAPSYKCAFVLPHEDYNAKLPSWAMKAYLSTEECLHWERRAGSSYPHRSHL